MTVGPKYFGFTYVICTNTIMNPHLPPSVMLVESFGGRFFQLVSPTAAGRVAIIPAAASVASSSDRGLLIAGLQRGGSEAVSPISERRAWGSSVRRYAIKAYAHVSLGQWEMALESSKKVVLLRSGLLSRSFLAVFSPV